MWNTQPYMHCHPPTTTTCTHTVLFWWLSGKRICLPSRRCRFSPWVGKIPWRRKWQPTPVFLPGKSHGGRKLADFSPWGLREFDIDSTHTHTHTHTHTGILFRLKKWNPIICSSMDESWRNYAMWNKLVTEGKSTIWLQLCEIHKVVKAESKVVITRD